VLVLERCQVGRSLVSQNLRDLCSLAHFSCARHRWKEKLNTSYFLGVLSLIAMHTAKSPYRTRTASAPFSDFGSTIGNDAGVNLFHEFGPGIQ
jgi:hypothetical protein